MTDVLIWLNANSGVLSTLATIALTFFAGVELWRGRKVTDRANAEVGAHAYALRRQLNGIIEGPTYIKTGALRGEAERITAEQLPAAEARALAMVTAAGGASERYAVAARKSYVLFYEAGDLINAVSEGRAYAKPVNDGAPSEFHHMQEAKDVLEECVHTLTRAIPRALAREAPDFSAASGFRSRLGKIWYRAAGVAD